MHDDEGCHQCDGAKDEDGIIDGELFASNAVRQAEHDCEYGECEYCGR